MIVWLASYPRSGNTLLRTILRQCMGIESYDDQVDDNVRAVNSSLDAEKIFGHISMPDSWDGFYTAASASDNLFFVKTHLPPRDDQPTIYVVRDGRNALLSYFYFHLKFFPKDAANLAGLILGMDEYTSWSEHIDAWNPFGRPNTLLLRYEELIDIESILLEKIARFIGYSGPIAEWNNPFKVLQQKIPNFFRLGNAIYQDDAEWTQWIDKVFFYCHGQMMIKLGYALVEEVSYVTDQLESDVTKLMDIARHSRRECVKYEKECRLRLIVINELKNTCDARLDLINTLDAELKRNNSSNGLIQSTKSEHKF